MSVSELTLKYDGFIAKAKTRLTKIKFDKWKGWIYLAPCIALLLVFTGWPIVNTLSMAFQNGYDTMEWLSGINFSIGIDNFLKVVSYSGFKDCLFNTVLLCVITVPISTVLALLIAVCLNSIKFLSRFLQLSLCHQFAFRRLHDRYRIRDPAGLDQRGGRRGNGVQGPRRRRKDVLEGARAP